MTLKSYYFGHTNGGSGLWGQCEQLCKDDLNCHSWMGRNSGNTCYLSTDTELKTGGGSDHHAYTLNEANCAALQPPPPLSLLKPVIPPP